MQARMPFNGQFLIGMPRCLLWPNSSFSCTRQPSSGICAPFSIQICVPIPNRHLTLILTSPHKPHHLDRRCLPHLRKILSHPLIPQPRDNSSLYFEHYAASAIVLGATRRSTMLQTLYSPPHLTRNIPGERPEISQPSSSHQTTARP